MLTHEQARQTGNAALTVTHNGPVSRKIFNAAMGIKEIIQRVVDHPASVEDLTRLANSLIAESERVAAMEAALLTPGLPPKHIKEHV